MIRGASSGSASAPTRVTLFAAVLLRGTDLGRGLREVGYGAGPAVFAAALLGGAAYAVYSFEQVERVGLRLFGLLHPAADGLKTIWKEDFVPPNADKFLHGLAPIVSFFPALVVMAVVPFGDTLCFGSNAGRHRSRPRSAESFPAKGSAPTARFSCRCST